MEAAIQQKVDTWLNGNFDNDVKSQIKKLQTANPDELADAFYRNLEFGTGGLRGMMGIGTNRINKYTIGKRNGSVFNAFAGTADISERL